MAMVPLVATMPPKLTGPTGVACPGSCCHSPTTTITHLPWVPDVIFLEVLTQNMSEQAGVGEESGRGSRRAQLPEAWEEERALLGKASTPHTK